MNQLFEFAINSSSNVTEAYNKLWHVSGAFSMISLNELIECQRWYLFNSKSITATKLTEFLCLEGRLPIYDQTIYKEIYNKNGDLFRNMWYNGIISLMYFDICNYEFSVLADAELSFLIGMAENREELGNYIESSIENWLDKNDCMVNLDSNIKGFINNKQVPNNTIPGMINGKNITDEIKEIIRDGFLYEEFTMKNENEPLNLIRNPRLHGDLIYYLTGLHRYYSNFMFKHPYYYNVTEFINSVLEDIETGIQYGVLEYYIDDTERRIIYDKEVDAMIFTYLTASIRRHN